MQNITLPKQAYEKLLKGQQRLQSEVAILRDAVLANIEAPLRPDILRRLEQRSGHLDKGNGKRFSGTKQLRRFLAGL